MFSSESDFEEKLVIFYIMNTVVINKFVTMTNSFNSINFLIVSFFKENDK